MRRIVRQILSIVSGILIGSTALGSLNFDSQSSGIKINSGAKLTFNQPDPGIYSGTLIKENGGTVNGFPVEFSKGILQDECNDVLLSGLFWPSTTSILLISDDILRAQPGTVLQQVFVGGTGARIEGAPLFSAPIKLQDEYTDVTFALQGTVNTNIDLSGGTVTLDNDLYLSDDNFFSSNGNVAGNGRKVFTGGKELTASANLCWRECSHLSLFACKTTLAGEWTFKDQMSFNGHGNVFEFDPLGKIIIAPDATVTMADVVLKGFGPDSIVFGNANSTLQLSNVTFELVDDIESTTGTYLFKGPGAVIVKDHTWTFVYDSQMIIDGVVVEKDEAGAEYAGDVVFNSDYNLSLIDNGTIKFCCFDNRCCRKLETRVEILESCCDAHDSRIDDIDSILEICCSDIDDFGNCCSEAEAALSCCDNHETRIVNLESCVELLKSDIDEECCSLAEFAASCCEAQETRIIDLESCCEANDSRIDLTESCCDNHETRIVDLESCVEILKSDIDEECCSLAEFAASCCESNVTRIEILESCVADLKSGIDEECCSLAEFAASCCDAQETRIIDLESCCDNHETRIVDLESCVELLKSDMDVFENCCSEAEAALSCCDNHETRILILELCCELLCDQLECCCSVAEEALSCCEAFEDCCSLAEFAASCCDAQETRIEDLESCCEENSSAIVELESCCDNHETRIVDLESCVELLKSDIDEECCSLAEFAASCCDAQETRIIDLESCCDNHETRIVDLESCVEILKSDIDEECCSLAEFAASCCESNVTRIEILESCVELLKSDIDEECCSLAEFAASCCDAQETRIIDLESCCDDHETRIIDLESCCDNHETRIVDLESCVELLKSDIDEECCSLAEFAASCCDAQETRIIDLESCCDNHETRIVDLESCVEILKSDIDEECCSLAEFAASCCESNVTRIEILESCVELLKSDIDEECCSLAEFAASCCDAQETRIIDLESCCDNHETRIVDLESCVELLKSDIDEECCSLAEFAASCCDAQETRIIDLESCCDNHETRIVDLESCVELLKSDIDEECCSLAEFAASCCDAQETRIIDLESCCDNHETRIVDLESCVELLKSDIDEECCSLAEFAASCCDAQETRIIDLESCCDNHETRIVDLESCVELLKSEVDEECCSLAEFAASCCESNVTRIEVLESCVDLLKSDMDEFDNCCSEAEAALSCCDAQDIRISILEICCELLCEQIYCCCWKAEEALSCCEELDSKVDALEECNLAIDVCCNIEKYAQAADTAPITTADWSFDHEYVAYGVGDQVKVFRYVGLALEQVASYDFAEDATVTALRWHPTLYRLVVGREGGTATNHLHILDFDSNNNLLTEEGMDELNDVFAVAWDPTGTCVAIGRDAAYAQLAVYLVGGGGLLVGPTVTGDAEAKISNQAIDFNKDGSFIAIGTDSTSKAVQVWEFDKNSSYLVLRQELSASTDPFNPLTPPVTSVSWNKGITLTDIDYLAFSAGGPVNNIANEIQVYAYKRDVNELELAAIPEPEVRTSAGDSVQSVHWNPAGTCLGASSFELNFNGDVKNVIRTYAFNPCKTFRLASYGQEGIYGRLVVTSSFDENVASVFFNTARWAPDAPVFLVAGGTGPQGRISIFRSICFIKDVIEDCCSAAENPPEPQVTGGGVAGDACCNIELYASLTDPCSINTADWSFDHKFVAYGVKDEVKVYRYTGLQLEFVASLDFAEGATVTALNWHPTEYRLVVGRVGGGSGYDHLHILDFDPNAQTLTQVGMDESSDVAAVVWHPSGDCVAIGRDVYSSELAIYAVNGAGVLTGPTVTGHTYSSINPQAIDFNKAGDFIAVGLEKINPSEDNFDQEPVLEVWEFDKNSSYLTRDSIANQRASVVSVSWNKGIETNAGDEFIAIAVALIDPPLPPPLTNPINTGLAPIQVYVLDDTEGLLREGGVIYNYVDPDFIKSVDWSISGNCLGAAGSNKQSGSGFIRTYTFVYNPSPQAFSELILTSNFVGDSGFYSSCFNTARWAPDSLVFLGAGTNTDQYGEEQGELAVFRSICFIREVFEECCSKADAALTCCEENASAIVELESCCEENSSAIIELETCCEENSSAIIELETCCEENASCCDNHETRIVDLESCVEILKSEVDNIDDCCSIAEAALSCCEDILSKIDTLSIFDGPDCCPECLMLLKDEPETILTPALLPPAGEAKILKFDPCFGPCEDKPCIIIDPANFPDGVVKLQPGSRLIICGEGTVKVEDGVNFQLCGTPDCDYTECFVPECRPTWPQLIIQDGTTLTLPENAVATVSGAGQVVTRYNGSILLDKPSQLIFGTSSEDHLEILTEYNSNITVRNDNINNKASDQSCGEAIVTMQKACLSVKFDHQSALNILPGGSVEFNMNRCSCLDYVTAPYGYEPEQACGRVLSLEFCEGSVLQVPCCFEQTGHLRLAPNCPTAEPAFCNGVPLCFSTKSAQVVGGGHIQYKEFVTDPNGLTLTNDTAFPQGAFITAGSKLIGLENNNGVKQPIQFRSVTLNECLELTHDTLLFANTVIAAGSRINGMPIANPMFVGSDTVFEQGTVLATDSMLGFKMLPSGTMLPDYAVFLPPVPQSRLGKGSFLAECSERVRTELELQSNHFAAIDEMVNIFKGLTLIQPFGDNRTRPPEDAAILARTSSCLEGEEGGLVAFCPPFRKCPDGKVKCDGSIVALKPGDHDVKYASSQNNGCLDLIIGTDFRGRPFRIEDCDELKRNGDPCP